MSRQHSGNHAGDRFERPACGYAVSSIERSKKGEHMDDKTMVRRVCEEAVLDEAAAREAIVATLSVLTQRIYVDEARHLADQLPVEFKEALADAGSQSPDGERFGAEEFVQRVAESMGTESGNTEKVLTSVLQVVSEAVEPGEWADVLAQLPSNMDSLFRGDKPSNHTG